MKDSKEFTVNRVELIDHTKTLENGGGRVYVNWHDIDMNVTLSEQDDGRTLKIFVDWPEIDE